MFKRFARALPFECWLVWMLQLGFQRCNSQVSSATWRRPRKPIHLGAQAPDQASERPRHRPGPLVFSGRVRCAAEHRVPRRRARGHRRRGVRRVGQQAAQGDRRAPVREKQLDFTDREVWCIVEDTGERHGAERFVTVYEWRDRKGDPIPYLSQGIVDEMKRRARTAPATFSPPARSPSGATRIGSSAARAETDRAYFEIGKDFDDHRRVGNFTFVPRSCSSSRRAPACARSAPSSSARSTRRCGFAGRWPHGSSARRCALSELALRHRDAGDLRVVQGGAARPVRARVGHTRYARLWTSFEWAFKMVEATAMRPSPARATSRCRPTSGRCAACSTTTASTSSRSSRRPSSTATTSPAASPGRPASRRRSRSSTGASSSARSRTPSTPTTARTSGSWATTRATRPAPSRSARWARPTRRRTSRGGRPSTGRFSSSELERSGSSSSTTRPGSALEQQFEDLVQGMVADDLLHDAGTVTSRQYGRDVV
jgi:hypothetical protein